MESTIKIDVTLDPTRMPENITWSASESTMDTARKAKAMILSFGTGLIKVPSGSTSGHEK
jgi:hypothetical protein